MKLSILIRLSFGLGLAVFIFASALRASLDEILAPLPVGELALSSSSVRPVERIQRTRPSGRSVADEQPATEEAEAPPANAILISDVHEELTAEVERHVRPNGELTLVPLRDLPDLSAYSHPFSVNLLNVPSRLSRGNLLLRFQVENEKGVLGEWNVPFRAHLYSDVWFPKSHLRRGDLATPSDFETRQVDLLAEPDAVPASLEMLLRHEYSRDLTPGKALLWRDLSERAMIRKGDVIDVTAVNGLLAISMRAVARQDGRDGDLILLRNIDSAREFSARVTGENRAEVAF